MDFSVFSNFYKNFYNLITNFLDFFDNGENEVQFDFIDEHGNHIMKKIPSLGTLKKEIKKEVKDELTAYIQYSKINNQFFNGNIEFKKHKRKGKLKVKVNGITKYHSIHNINCKEELDIDFNYNNYLYYDIKMHTLFLSPKPFKISLNENFLIVSRNSRFSKYKSIDTNYLIYKNDIINFFNNYFPLEKKDLTIDFCLFSKEKNDYFEIIFSFDKYVNIDNFLLETDFIGTFQILGSTNGKLYHKIYTKEIKNNNNKDSIQNIIDRFANANYYKYYKVRFYNEKIKESFTIRNINLLTRNTVWFDILNNRVNEIIDDIPIERQLIYLGEFKKIKDKKNKIIFYPYNTKNIFYTDFEKFNFNFCIDNPFKDDTIDIKIYISENKLGSVIEDGTKYFKILYNSEKIEVILHPDAFINNLNEFYIQLEILRRDYDYIGA